MSAIFSYSSHAILQFKLEFSVYKYFERNTFLV
jgi:hypothetical protein